MVEISFKEQKMPNKINKDMTFGELIQSFPEAGPILAGYGLHCVGCHIGVSETIEQGAMAHGLNGQQIEEMVSRLNEVV